MDMFRQACVAELKSLMVTWDDYQKSKKATDAEFVRVGERIRKLCDYLDRLDRA